MGAWNRRPSLATGPEIQRRDLLTGLFVLGAIGVMLGTLVITSGLLHRRHDVYMRTASAQDLTQDTRVLLQGLAVGRVRQVDPLLDSATGSLTFVARLSIDAEFPNGARVMIPRGTHAVIEQMNPIAPPVIQLIVPQGVARAPVQVADTIASERVQGAMDALGRIAGDLSDELRTTIQETRALVRQTTRTAQETEHLVSASTPRVEEVLTQLTTSLERADRMLADLGPRVGPLTDSLTAILADTRRTLRQVTTLAQTADSLAGENRVPIQETIQHLHNSAVLLEHFADQVSRRPTRLLTGVQPLPLDTSRKQP
jgi:ABC-type transporter Mla subunit MlaD